MDYCPHTIKDIEQMQAAIGVAGLDELFADIPQKFRLNKIPDIPAALSEQQTMAVMGELARKNKPTMPPALPGLFFRPLVPDSESLSPCLCFVQAPRRIFVYW